MWTGTALLPDPPDEASGRFPGVSSTSREAGASRSSSTLYRSLHTWACSRSRTNPPGRPRSCRRPCTQRLALAWPSRTCSYAPKRILRWGSRS
jgi:hypothetical protein